MMVTTFMIVMVVAVGEVMPQWWKGSEISLHQWEKTRDQREESLSLTLAVNASSVLVFLGGVSVYGKQAEGEEGGVHVLVVHVRTGHVMLARHFRTHQPGSQHTLRACLASLQPGRALLLLGQPEFITYLWPEGGEVLSQMGATLLPQVAVGEPWAMVTLTGQAQGLNLGSGKILGETVATRELGRPSRTLLLQVDLPRAPSGEWCGREWAAEMWAQAEFCELYEGYGGLCDCGRPYIPTKRPPPPSIDMTEDIPVVIVTANKPYYLYRLLKNLKQVEGSGQTKILVAIDGPHQETLQLANLFQVSTVVHTPQGPPGKNTRTNANIAYALYSVLERWPHVDKVILLEDDLILSPDLLRYFHQAAPALTIDPTLYLVNAFGQNSYPNTASDPSTVLRAEMYPQYGWMTCRRWIEYVLPLWVPSGGGVDWDWWVYTEGVRGGMDAVVPEVSRTAHAGSAGVHVTGWEQHLFFSSRLLNRDPHTTLKGIHRLVAQNYSDWMENEIRSATKLNFNDHPCHTHIIPNNMTGPFVLFLGVVSRSDEYNSFYIMQACLGTDDQEVKELYEGVIRLRVHPYSHTLVQHARNLNLRDSHTLYHTDLTPNWRTGAPEQSADKWKVLYLVGCPLSKYCKYSMGTSDWVVPGEELVVEASKVVYRRRMAGVHQAARVRVAASSSEEEFNLNNVFEQM
ncbi:protein O-linked-mannose beta-1,2-N-acetylglucosaminyltransferase 1 [Procambarus clarkii]|uniref:protein O-linked-mannose beta-1,2-N-acetylglucosaminyltransferase 1 n=1 Tax=Procambarus clarkii TaxID=6728 RepID=UPI0037421F23